MRLAQTAPNFNNSIPAASFDATTSVRHLLERELLKGEVQRRRRDEKKRWEERKMVREEEVEHEECLIGNIEGVTG